jgi:hypothetical protein
VIARAHALVLAASAFLLVACGKDAALATDCGAVPSPSVMERTANWGPADTPLFLVQDDGRLLRGNMAGGELKTVADHGFAGAMVSPDGRWLVGSAGGAGSRKLRLYDTATGSDRIVPLREGKGEALPLVSPDSRSIAVFANADPRAPVGDGIGLYLVDIETATARHVGLPPGASFDPVRQHGSTRWSAEGDVLYLFLTDYDIDTVPRTDIFRLRPADGHFETVIGEYNRAPWNTELRVEGHLVPLARQIPLDDHLPAKHLASADGALEARIDPGKSELRIQHADGESHAIAVVRYNQCGVASVFIDGWIDHYLLYEVDSALWIHDADHDRSRQLAPAAVAYHWPTRPVGIR